MRAVGVHPFSMFAGAVLLGVVLVSTGALQVGAPAQTLAAGERPIKVVGIPDPRDMVVIREGTPYVVPAGKLFVLTALGSTSANWFTRTGAGLLVNGVGVPGPNTTHHACSTYPCGSSFQYTDPSVISVPRYVVGGGSTIDVQGGGDGRAWGYLADAQGSSSTLRGIRNPVEVGGIMDPRDWMSVSRDPNTGVGVFVVPPGKLFVLEGISGTLKVDGIREVEAISGAQSVPPGFTVGEGSTIEISGEATTGYLIDA